MKRLTRLPRHALVSPEATARLQEKFRQAKRAAANDAYWLGVQAMKQPGFTWSWDANGTPTDWELPIG
jgi:hypothetical protein